MKALAHLESILQNLMERPQWLLSPKRVHPLAIAAEITRGMESNVLPVGDRVLAPNLYTVRLNPDDYQQFGPVRRTLEREMAMYVTRATEERDLRLPSSPSVQFVEDAKVRSGDIKVEALFSEEAFPKATISVPVRAPMAGFTEKIDRASVGPFTPPVNGHAALELLSEQGKVLRSIPIEAPVITIGRRSGNDVALIDLEISRQHARIDFVAPRYYVSDLGSTNGTRVNGRTVGGRQALNDGDLIELGGQRLRFRYSG
jgi:hypothetical protein